MARILVIDDEAMVRRAIVRMLAAGAHDAVEAPDATAGLRLWREQGADVVVTDIALPDMTGFELIGLLRSEGETVPIIAISGSLVVSDLELIADRLGIVELLAKPFSGDQLLSAVSKALADNARH
jgi:CheY-like chemotaxis protein